jgi:hypothetical protein
MLTRGNDDRSSLAASAASPSVAKSKSNKEKSNVHRKEDSTHGRGDSRTDFTN